MARSPVQRVAYDTRGFQLTCFLFSLLVGGVTFSGSLEASGPTGRIIGKRLTAHGMECVVCHVPEPAGEDPVRGDRQPQGPLWNSSESSTSFRLYTTQAGNTGKLDGPSALCLSCHDGVTAADGYGGTKGAPAGRPRQGILGADLTDDHPVGVEYPPRDKRGRPLRGYRQAPREDLRLAEVNGVQRVECISCHDPHGSSNGRMLRAGLEGSALCFGCHDM